MTPDTALREAQSRPAVTRPTVGSVLPGLGAAVGIAAVAVAGGQEVPILGAPVLAVLTGVLLSRAAGRVPALGPGIAVAARDVLPLAIVLLGAQLSLGQVVHVGGASFPVMVGTLGACLVAARVAGRALGIDDDLRTLIGVGTAICGASAIAAVSPAIRARSHAVSYAVSTIFFFNIAAVLVFPGLGHLLGLSQTQFGLFAGTAVNDTSSVVAAATTYGAAAGTYAVVVKLTRTLMIVPVSLTLGWLANRRAAASGESAGVVGGARPRRFPVPWFLAGFLAVAAANSVGLVPVGVHPALLHGSGVLIATALAGIGLSTDLGGLRRAGLRPLLLGAILWLVVSSTSLVLQLVA